MPPLQAHLTRARENVALYVAQKSVLPPHWQATILFYAAVHYVEAMCDALGDGGHVTHRERDDYIYNKHTLDLWRPYSRLKRESIKARYLTTSESNWQRGAFSLTVAQVEQQLHQRALQEVIAYVETVAPALKPSITMRAGTARSS